MAKRLNPGWVDIIIPYFNAEKYIVETLISVEEQSYDLIRVICVDNNSTDSSLSLVTEFSSRSKFQYVLESEEQKYASSARNKGIEKVESEFVCFLDSDDVITPDKIEKQVKFLINHPNVDLVISDRIVYNDDFSKIIKKITFEKIEKLDLNACITNIFITGNPLYRTNLVSEVGGYNSDLKVAQDWEFHLRIGLRKPNFGYVRGFFLWCRSHPNSLSNNWKEVSLCQEEILENLLLKSQWRKLNPPSLSYITEIIFNNAIYGEISKLRGRIDKLWRLKKLVKNFNENRLNKIEFSHPFVMNFYFSLKRLKNKMLPTKLD